MIKDPEAFKTISEVSKELDMPQHVLRFWETKFPLIKPLKRAGGRRYYRPIDLKLLIGIKKLLYHEGYTITGVQKLLRKHNAKWVIDFGGNNNNDDNYTDQTLATYEQDNFADISSSNHDENGQKMKEPDKKTANQSKSSSNLDNGSDQSKTGDTDKNLDSSDIKKLEKVIFDLLECKRMLDNVSQRT